LWRIETDVDEEGVGSTGCGALPDVGDDKECLGGGELIFVYIYCSYGCKGMARLNCLCIKKKKKKRLFFSRQWYKIE
jgi:hypothetical protein